MAVRDRREALCETWLRTHWNDGTAAPMASWQVWALASAAFAALTAIFAKIGVAEFNPDAATLIRTVVILIMLTAIVAASRELPALTAASGRTYAFLILSGLATGASWWCYFRALRVGDAARVAPLDKLSVVLVALFGVAFLGERLGPLNWLGVAMMAVGAWFVTIRP
jgi:bacterial/archaeal transporter family protein